MDYMKIYNNSPIFMQNFACLIEGMRIKHTRYNKKFKNIFTEYKEREEWSYEQICEYRDEQLRKLILHSYKTVPYYRDFFNQSGLNPANVKGIDDLKKLPIISKKIINKDINRFISETYPLNKRIKLHTSGTTGSGFKFYSTEESIHNQWSAFWRARYGLGINFETWCGNFGSRLVVPIAQNKPPYWRYNIPGRQIYFSGFHENEENLYEYYKKIQDSKLTWLHGYPSIITLLANYILEGKLPKIDSIKYITTGAENLLSNQKNMIEIAFGTIPREVYGQSENVAIFTERSDGEIVVEDDFSAVEFLNTGDEQYQIIGTNLYNYSMPLIRYDTKDIVSNVSYSNQNNRRTVKEIDGRNEDYIYLKDGRKIGKLDHVFKDTISFAEVQIYQNKSYDITIFVVRGGRDWQKDEKNATELLRRSIGDDLEIEFKYVSRIEKTKGRKLKFVVSEVETK